MRACRQLTRFFLRTSVLLLLSSCAHTPPDYTLFRERAPKSILVVAPSNTTASIDAPAEFMSTISAAVGERGYYVFPVAVVDQMFRENGVATPAEIREVPYKKLREIFGADALLNVTINAWGTNYAVIYSATEVSLDYELIDLTTGAQLWSGSATVKKTPQSNNDLAGIVAEALVHALVSTVSHPEIDLARQANFEALHDDDHGLLAGPRLPRDPRSP